MITEARSPLIRNFNAIRETTFDTDSEGVIDLEKILNNQDSYIELFNLANSAWSEIFDQQEVLRILESNPTAGDIKSLSRLRKFGIILKSFFILFSEDHLAPHEFHLLIRHLGKLKDAFTNNRAESSKFIKSRNVILNLLRNSNNLKDFVLKPATSESTKTYINTQVLHYLDLLKNKDIPMHELHDLRKFLRTIMNIFQGLAVKDVGNTDNQTFIIIEHAVAELGYINDQAVSTEFNKGIPYETQTHILPVSLKRELILLLLQLVYKDLVPKDRLFAYIEILSSSMTNNRMQITETDQDEQPLSFDANSSDFINIRSLLKGSRRFN